jgi:UDP-glucose 4-epimerase
MKRYLVLGGNGFIGKYIVEKLAIDNEVVIADFNIENKMPIKNVKYKKIDFTKTEDFDEYLDNIDIVIHLISTIMPSDNIKNINKELEENVFSTINLLNGCVKKNIEQIIFVSSGGTVYGEHDILPIKEDEKKNPICNYGIIKELIEKYLALYFHNYGLNYKVVRLGNPYSEKMKNGKRQGIIPIIIDQIINNKPIKIWGDGEDIRDYIFIDDAIDAIIKVIEYEGNEKIFNIGTGKGISINKLIDIIKKYLSEYDIKVEYTNSRKCDVKNNILDISKIEKETGWTPTTNVESGIKKIIEIKKNHS